MLNLALSAAVRQGQALGAFHESLAELAVGKAHVALGKGTKGWCRKAVLVFFRRAKPKDCFGHGTVADNVDMAKDGLFGVQQGMASPLPCKAALRSQ